MENETHRDAYARRIERVVHYICVHLDEELSLDALSQVAGFSKFHFHRQFSEFTGFAVARFVRLKRLERAAYQLAFDPGRAAITGDPHDFEAFDMPSLRGIANTAPYFHDNAAETLRDLVNIYSRFIIQFFPMLNRPLVNPPEAGSTFPESFTPQEKDDLIAFLQIL